jgi:hypothetical protein
MIIFTTTTSNHAEPSPPEVGQQRTAVARMKSSIDLNQPAKLSRT